MLIETQDSPQSGICERKARARQAIAMKTSKIHALLKIDLSCAWSLERTIPSVRRVEIVFVELGLLAEMSGDETVAAVKPVRDARFARQVT